MRKILASLVMISSLAGALTLGTVSFFSDTEVSADNRFTSGSIDLQVDSQARYNGFVCDGQTWNCDKWADQVVSFDQGQRKNGSSVVAERSNPNSALGVAQNNDTINFVALGFGGELVLEFTNTIVNGAGNDVRVVETSFGNIAYANYPESADVFASQDGSSWQKLGVAQLDGSFDLENADGGPMAWAKFIKIVDTSNTASPQFPSDADGYDVDAVEALNSNCEPAFLQGQACESTWELTDLGPENKFFDYADIKPGDEGSNSISLHVYDNDAFACMYVTDVEDKEMTHTAPEIADGDLTEVEGELAGALQFFLWRDTNGNNVFDVGEEKITENPILASTWLSDAVYTLFDNASGPLTGLETSYVGMAWCAGQMTVTEGAFNAITCDGSTMSNVTQTDEMTANISLYVEQSRNNPDFTCALPEEVTGTVTSGDQQVDL